MMYKIQYLPIAKDDLRKILLYISNHFHIQFTKLQRSYISNIE